MPPTPPPDIDLDAWRVSEDRILSWDPDTFFLTHFGPFHGARVHFQDMTERLALWSRIVRRLLADASLDEDQRLNQFLTRGAARARSERSGRWRPSGPTAPAGWTIPGRACRGCLEEALLKTAGTVPLLLIRGSVSCTNQLGFSQASSSLAATVWFSASSTSQYRADTPAR